MQKRSYQTAGRRALIDYLQTFARQLPRSADEIYAALSASGTTPGRSTVYRQLSELCREGKVRRFRADAEGEGYVYQYVVDHGNCGGHLHLQCRVCGGVSHLDCGCSDFVAQQLLQEHGFRLDNGRSVLYGTCAACASKEVHK
jgi:Fur family ferric uptake transcriptional regulator